MKGFLIFIFALIVLGATALAAALTPGGDQTPGSDEQEQVFRPFESLAPNTIVYGYWTTDGATEIKSLNMSTGQTSLLATLPYDIKRVRVVSPDQLLYIANTNERDHGTELLLYTISSKTSTKIATADEGYGIDEYVVSPNGRYVATWEVFIPDSSERLLTGSSRVYTADVTIQGQKNILFDEQANVPIHYPLAVTNDGTVILDKFLPNGTVEYGYGLSTSDFTGNIKQDIEGLQNGVISTQPVISPDGKYLAYSMFDGAGGTNVVNDFRTAITTPNAVEVFDITNRSRTRLEAFPSSNRYPAVIWDEVTGKLIVSVVSAVPEESGQFEYDMLTNQKREIALGVGNEQRSIVSQLSDGKVLVANREDSVSALGNLGPSYSPSFNGFEVIDSSNVSGAPVPINEGLVQPIGVFADTYFQDSALASTQSLDGQSSTKTQDTLQLQTFTLKPSLAPKREQQQSQPRCRTLAAQICNDLLGTSFTGEERANTENSSYNQCWNEQFRAKDNRAACYDSPLYIYGEPGTSVSINIDTEIYNETPEYTDSYEITIDDSKRMVIGGKKYDKIDFDYVSKPVAPPQYGIVSHVSQLESILLFYGESLGLTDTEISDTVTEVTQQITKPYVFVSFFSQGESKQILPIRFTPHPDTYINYVFYLKEYESLPRFTPTFPSFGSVQERGELTAVEVSWIIE